MKTQERINLTRQADKQIRSREESKTTQKPLKCQELQHTFLIMTLNINGLNSPIKRCKLVDWIKKQVLTIYAYKE
jgi:hypothetical protein